MTASPTALLSNHNPFAVGSPRYRGNSNDRVWPVDSLKPDDFGLFDMRGNVCEWCTDHAFTDRVHLSAGLMVRRRSTSLRPPRVKHCRKPDTTRMDFAWFEQSSRANPNSNTFVRLNQRQNGYCQAFDRDLHIDRCVGSMVGSCVHAE
ncbi:MAG: SUMF1/EgtB/PvdO family nonheme iron enzyme [Planctomycetes bacterium]|nr:SUMF1/EgtB/PvdO family nonheme iron enzyme [Planctomycetota bacterium]